MVTFWIIAAIGAIVLECATPLALVSIWFGIGAIFAAISAYLGITLYLQIFVFFVISLTSMAIIRPLATKYLRGNTVPTNADRLINEQGLITKSIKEDCWGEVKIKGVLWSAISVDQTDIEEGTHIRVIAIEGAKLIVKSIESKKEGK
ncbi:MAG: NfeD family protein [Erysipelotrichaceae bacterium]